MAVCVGPEFEVDGDARLRINICGDPAEQAWPYDCAPSVGNPLRVDPDCGLWTEPKGYVTIGSSGRAVDISRPMTAGDVDTELAVVTRTVTNPDPCRAMRFFVVYRYNWTVDGPSASHWRFQRAATPGPGGGAPGAPVTVIQVQTPAAADEIAYSDVALVAYTVPAGGSMLLQMDLAIILDSGTGTVVQYGGTIETIGVTA